jgi:acyl-coenzyme A thioesterase PaaI-like protein
VGREERQKYAPPEFKPEPGWEVLPDLAVIGGSRPFVTGEDSARVLRLCYFRRKGDGALVGKVWFGPGAEGPPHHAHGGAIAGVFDDVMGGAAWLAGHPILAARVTVEFRKPVPLGVEAIYEAWVETVDGRRVKARGRMVSPDGRVYAEGDGIFVLIEPDRLGEMKERVLEIIQRAGIPFQNK